MVIRSVFYLLIFSVCLLGNQSVMAQDLLGSDPFGLSDGPLDLNSGFGLKKSGKAELACSLKPHENQSGFVILEISLKIPQGSYTYSTNPAFGAATRLTVKSLEGVVESSAPFTPDHPPKTSYSEDFEQDVEKYTDQVTWTRDYQIKPDQKVVSIEGVAEFQVCDATTCRPYLEDFSANLDLSQSHLSEVVGNNIALADSSITMSDEDVSEEDVVPFGQAESEVTVPPSEPKENVTTFSADSTPKAPGSDGLMQFLIAAFTAGLLALLTPCVFPMIPVTVSFFLKKAEKKQGNPVVLASVYCLGIMGGFTILGVIMSAVFGATALTALANNAWLNIALAVFLIVFAFNLLGMFEISVPYWMMNLSSSREGQGGIIGVLFMALTFTLVSFTCTFGFVGLLLVYASRGDLLWPILGMLTFSFAFALPFFFLALFPSYLASLPKSGGWMNNVKVILGIVEIAFAFKFLSVADLAWHPEAYFFDYGLVMSAWMVLSLVAGFYLLGMFRLPHDTPVQQISVVKFAIAISFLGLGAYFAQGIFAAKKPTGFVWQQIESFAPPVFEYEVTPTGMANQMMPIPEDLGPYLVHHGLEFALDYEIASAYAKAHGKPMLLDFTGVNCINCRKMEKTVLSKPAVLDKLGEFVRVQLFTDTDAIPGINDPVKGEKLHQYNIKLQEDWFGDVSLPAYVVVSPDGKIMSRLSGYNPDPQVFINFLEAGINNWKSQTIALK